MSTEIQETINRLRELDRVTAPAPWRDTIDENNPDMPCLLLDSEGGTVAEGEEHWEGYWSHIDNMVPLLTELRNALPDLLAEIDRLTTENTRLLGAVAKAWEEGRQEGRFSGRHLERTGYGVPYKNPYQEDKGTWR